MHKNFGEWYRIVSIEPHGETLKKRWAGVEEWVSILRTEDGAILETVRIFRGLPAKVSREPFLAVFRSIDPAFPQRNELELRVLAGASLVRCVQLDEYQDEDEDEDEGKDEDEDEDEGKDEGKDVGMRTAIIAGTALAASNFCVSDPTLHEVAGEVLSALQTIARSRRRRGQMEMDGIRIATNAAADAKIGLTQASNWTNLRDQIVPAFQSLLDVARILQTALTNASHSLRCADEETNILWWLEGGSSRDLDKPWSEIPVDAVPLIAALELADLTDVALGPQDAAAILDRVVTKAKCKETSIRDYVNAVPDEWVRARWVQKLDNALDLAPLSLALSHRAGSNSSSWQQFFEGTSGLKASTSLAPERVARQAYIEAVLLRTLADAED